MKTTKEKLETIAKKSICYADMLRAIGVTAQGGNYNTLKKYIKKFDIDISHFKNLIHILKRRQRGAKKGAPIEDYLKEDISIDSCWLKERLIKEGIKLRKCESCKLEKWLDGPIPIELDHIDGNRRNNLLSNLRILCPNCHTLTPTYRGRKNKGRKINNFELINIENAEKILLEISKDREVDIKNFLKNIKRVESTKSTKYKIKIMKECNFCKSNYISQRYNSDIKGRKYCSDKCSQKASRRVDRPDAVTLKELVWSKPVSTIAKEFGVSDNAVKKWCVKYSIETPPRGYWAKNR